MKHIKLITPHVTIGTHCHDAGDVVQVDDRVAKRLVDRKHAVPCDAPAVARVDDVEHATARNVNVERATRRARS